MENDTGDRTRYAPILSPSSGLRWARRKAVGERASRLHVANSAGRLLCDGGPGVSRSVPEPTLESQVHSLCLHVLRKRGLA